jgi:hypothetical protein
LPSLHCTCLEIINVITLYLSGHSYRHYIVRVWTFLPYLHCTCLDIINVITLYLSGHSYRHYIVLLWTFLSSLHCTSLDIINIITLYLSGHSCRHCIVPVWTLLQSAFSDVIVSIMFYISLLVIYLLYHFIAGLLWRHTLLNFGQFVRVLSASVPLVLSP